MSESKSINHRFNFNRSVRIETRPYRLSAHTGVLLLRDVDDLFGITSDLAAQLQDPRDTNLITHPLSELIRTRMYLIASGSRDQDDADQLREDSILRLAVSERRGLSPLQTPVPDQNQPEGLASQPTLSRLLVSLSPEANTKVLKKSLLSNAIKHYRATFSSTNEGFTVDTDSFDLEAFGEQPGSSYNEYYGIRCFHPIVTFLAETGDIVGIESRPGHVHTANGVEDHLFPIIDEIENELGRVAYVRGDAGFPNEPLLKGLETKGVKYTFRIKSNPNLERLAAPHLDEFQKQPKPLVFHELSYQAESWSRQRRVTLVLIENTGQLFPDYFFIVNNWSLAEKSSEDVLEFYRQRGTAEGLIGELKSALDPHLSSTNRSKSHYRGKPVENKTTSRNAALANAVNLLLFALAYNLANMARRFSSQEDVNNGKPRWSIARFQERVLRTASRLVVTGRRLIVIISETVHDHWQRAISGIERLREKCVNTT